MEESNRHTPNQELFFHKQLCGGLYRTTWEPITKTKEELMTYYNNPKKTTTKVEFDLYFSFMRRFPVYDQRKSKENRTFLADIRERIFEQELKKAVPVLISLNYGKRKPYDLTETKFNHVDHISSFYRRNGPFGIAEKQVSSGSYEMATSF